MRVRGPEIDSWGHVNNAVYLQWFEHARWEMARISNLIERFEGALPYVRSVHLDFLKETLYGDVVEVRLWPDSLGDSSFVLGGDIRVVEAEDGRRVGLTVMTSSMAFTMVKPGVGKQPVPPFFRKYFSSDPTPSS